MTILVTGGSKCGKSGFAEKILDNYKGRKIYIATMEPYGDDAFEAIERHRKMRFGKGFETAEKYRSINELVIPENSAVLLECMGNLIANEMFVGDEIRDPAEKIISGIENLKNQTELLVIVTNEAGSDGIKYADGTMKYIEVIGRINQRIAGISDEVYECVFGIPIKLKG